MALRTYFAFNGVVLSSSSPEAEIFAAPSARLTWDPPTSDVPPKDVTSDSMHGFYWRGALFISIKISEIELRLHRTST